MTAVFGFELDDLALKALVKDLKRHCGTGGSVKDRMIVIQGDHRDAVKGVLEGKGFRVKIAGGGGDDFTIVAVVSVCLV